MRGLTLIPVRSLWNSEDSGDEMSYTVPDFDSVLSWEYVTSENCVNIRHEDVLHYFIYKNNPVSGKTKN